MVPTALLVLLLTMQVFLTDAFSPPRVANRGVEAVVRHPLHNLHTPSSTDVFQRIPRPTPISRHVTSLSVTSGDFAAGGTLLISSMIGMMSEKFNFSGGHVVTLLSAALLSNSSRVVPTDHLLYNLCWSIFLPSSLVFALLSTSSARERTTGYTPVTKKRKEEEDDGDDDDDNDDDDVNVDAASRKLFPGDTPANAANANSMPFADLVGEGNNRLAIRVLEECGCIRRAE